MNLNKKTKEEIEKLQRKLNIESGGLQNTGSITSELSRVTERINAYKKNNEKLEKANKFVEKDKIKPRANHYNVKKDNHIN